MTALWITESGHAAALVDAQHDVPGQAARVALEETQLFDDQLAALDVKVLEVAAHGARCIEVLRHGHWRMAKSIQFAGQRLAHFRFELATDLFDHLANDLARHLENFALQVATQREQRAQQLLVGLQALQRLRIGDELGEAIAIERVLLDDLDRVLRKQLAHFAEPGHEVQLGRVERARRDLLAQAAAFVFAAIEVVERVIATPVLSLQSAAAIGRLSLGVFPEYQPPACQVFHGLAHPARPSASSTSDKVCDNARLARS